MSCDCDYALDASAVGEQHYSNCRSLNRETKSLRNPDGSIQLPNGNLAGMEVDYLYHLGLDTKNYDLPAMFGDVKFVCIGGTKHRMRDFAKFTADNLGYPLGKLMNLTKHSQRYAMYKVGPVLAVSHGVGIPSMTTALQEVIKLIYYAKAKDPFIFRIGTSGGLGVPPGSVVVSSLGLNGTLEASYDLPILGKVRCMPSFLDKRLSQEIAALVTDSEDFQTFVGATMGADDFYRGQARLDGPFCDYTEEDKKMFLLKLVEMGAKNIEMEANAFAAYTSQAGLRGAIVCVTLLNRLEGDQVTTSKAVLTQWQSRPMLVVGKFIKTYLQKNELMK